MERTQAALERARMQRGLGVAGLADAGGAVAEPRNEAAQAPAPPWLELSPAHLRRHRILAGVGDGEVANVFRMLRAQVLRRLRGRGAKTIAICSARDGEGKTVVAVNLALALALEPNHSVLLVDLDLRRPSVHRYLGLTPEYGLDDVLAGQATVEQALMRVGSEDLTVLPTRGGIAMASEVLMSPRMAALAKQLREASPGRLVIYDLPPVLQVDDCLAFLRHLDACLFVVEEGTSRGNEVARALSLVDKDKIVGTILNKSSSTAEQTYDYYGN